MKTFSRRPLLGFEKCTYLKNIDHMMINAQEGGNETLGGVKLRKA